jgi:hypothetical protein
MDVVHRLQSASAERRLVMRDENAWKSRLELDGLIERSEDTIRTTRLWQAALARAAFQLFRDGEELADIRVPIAAALAERYPGIENNDLATVVSVMFPIAVGELSAIEAAARRYDHFE